MAPFYPLFIFSVLPFAFTALGQQQIQVATPSVIQCANVLIQWSGGVSPFNLDFATTPDANISSFEIIPNIQSSPYTWPDDLAAGTPFTIGVTDSNGISGESQTIVVQDSKNTSCLDNSLQASSSTPFLSHTSHVRGQSGAQTSVGASSSSTDTGAPAPTASSSQSSSSNHTSRVPIIAGVIAGVLALLSVIAILLYLQRRKDRRRTTTKEEMIRTFGSSKAALDSPGDEEAEEMAVPEPYVYKSVTRAKFTNLAPGERDSPRHSGTSTSRSIDSSPTPPPNLAARKGERYLPNDTTPNDNGPGGSSQSRIQEEDIDRLAARMVAMMSSGRLSDQAWAPQAGGQNARNKGFDVADDLPAAPPTYNDVARRNSGAPHSSGGR